MRLPWGEKVAGGKRFHPLSVAVRENNIRYRDRRMVKEVDGRQRERKNSFKMSRKDNVARWER